MAVSGKLEIEAGTTPPTPSTGLGAIYPKNDGFWYTLDDGGVETKLLSSGIVEDAINNGVVDKAPSQNAVFDALVLKQNQDAGLDALAAFNTNGLIVQTANNTFSGRTLTAGAGISIGNGDGVAGNPTIASTITQYTDTDARAAVVIDSIADSDIDHAPSRNAVFDALATRDATIAGKQPLDATLTALSSFNTNGLVVQTAADTFTGRSLSAGAGISITNPQGIAGDPVISCTITQYTDELAQDAIGGALLATPTITPTYNDGANQFSWDVNASSITDAKLSTGINANKIGGGAVDNTEFSYLDGVTSSIQTQLSGKAPTTRTITTSSTSGLQGGGDLSADRSLSLNFDGLTAQTERPALGDELAIYDVSQAAHRKQTLKQFLSQRGTLIDQAYIEQDDFIRATDGGLTGVGAGTGNSTQIGAYGFDNIENAIGISESDTGTTATGRRALVSGLTTLTPGIGRFRFGLRMALNQLSDGTNTFTQYIGFLDNSGAGDMTDALYFRYTDAVNSGRWEAVSSRNGTRTATDTGISANVIYNIFEIEINEAGTSVTYYINGTLVATNTTNIPATNVDKFGYGWKIEKSVGITAAAMSADYYYFELERTNAR